MATGGAGAGAGDATQPLKKLEAFLGCSPGLFLEDVYRAGEDYCSDAVDALEREVLQLCSDSAARRAKGRGAARKGAAGGPTESALAEEVARGADACWDFMLRAHALTGDQFEAYVLRNVFTWPEGLVVAVSGVGLV